MSLELNSTATVPEIALIFVSAIGIVVFLWNVSAAMRDVHYETALEALQTEKWNASIRVTARMTLRDAIIGLIAQLSLFCISIYQVTQPPGNPDDALPLPNLLFTSVVIAISLLFVMGALLNLRDRESRNGVLVRGLIERLRADNGDTPEAEVEAERETGGEC